MEQLAPKILILLTLACSSWGICVEYSKGCCLVCEPQQRLVDGKCYDSVNGCLEYDREQKCVLCQGNALPLANRSCPALQTTSNRSVTLYTLSYGQSSITNYLDPHQCKKDPLFDRCDTFLRTGEYRHFISKTSLPWQSISFQIRGTLKIYRIIYFGAGGGIMLCIIQIDSSTFAIVLQSLVTIAATELVSDCLDYTVDRKCARCKTNCHLEQNQCYPNIGGCISYFRNICLECEGWGLLVENRCIYDCNNQCDTWHMPYFSNLLLHS